MKKTLIITAIATLSMSISSVVFAGDIEKAERYSAPLEQNVVEMDMSAAPNDIDVSIQTKLELGGSLGSNAEIQQLGSVCDIPPKGL